MSDTSKKRLTAISLGAGVQSSAMYLMACEGHWEPVPDVAIFADTQCEPPWVYEQLDYLRRVGTIPVHVATAGDLAADVLASQQGSRFASVPFFTRAESGNGKGGMGRRQCTREYKIDVINKATRELLGLKYRQRAAGVIEVEQWIGISRDEAQRMKPARAAWVTSRWPLIEADMSRADCLRWLRDNGHPEPERSACIFCPYHSNGYWKWLKKNHPKQWEIACDFDEALRAKKLRGTRQHVYVHVQRRPLREIDVDAQSEFDWGWGNECEGMCGV